jgi:hypothetical protein
VRPGYYADTGEDALILTLDLTAASRLLSPDGAA